MEDFFESIADDRWNPASEGEVPFKTEDNKQVAIFSSDSVEPPDPNNFETLEEFEAAWQQWENLNIFPCLQVSADLSKESKSLGETSSPPNLLKSTPTRKQSCGLDTQESPSTATLETIPPESVNLTSLPVDFPVSAQVLPEMEADSNTQNQSCGLKHCDVLPKDNPTLLSSKTLGDLSVEDCEQYLEDCEWLDIVGTIHSSYRARNSAHPMKEKGCSLLPTPTTYAKGSGKYRPAGATRLEQSLRNYIAAGDKLHPAVPGWMMGFPPGWVEDILMDIGQAQYLQLSLIPEWVVTHPSVGSVTTSTPGQSVHCRRQFHS